jgi:hypothetical protein
MTHKPILHSLPNLSPQAARPTQQRELTPPTTHITQHTCGRNKGLVRQTKTHSTCHNLLIVHDKVLFNSNSRHAPISPTSSRTETRKFSHPTANKRICQKCSGFQPEFLISVSPTEHLSHAPAIHAAPIRKRPPNHINNFLANLLGLLNHG